MAPSCLQIMNSSQGSTSPPSPCPALRPTLSRDLADLATESLTLHSLHEVLSRLALPAARIESCPMCFSKETWLVTTACSTRGASRPEQSAIRAAQPRANPHTQARPERAATHSSSTKAGGTTVKRTGSDWWAWVRTRAPHRPASPLRLQRVPVTRVGRAAQPAALVRELGQDTHRSAGYASTCLSSVPSPVVPQSRARAFLTSVLLHQY